METGGSYLLPELKMNMKKRGVANLKQLCLNFLPIDDRIYVLEQKHLHRELVSTLFPTL